MVVFLASASILVPRSSPSLKAQKIGLGAGLFDVTVAGIRSVDMIRRSLAMHWYEIMRHLACGPQANSRFSKIEV